MSDDVPQRVMPTGSLVPPDLDEAMVAAVVAAFYAKARRDDLIGPVFNRVVAAEHWPQHIQTITDFWSAMLLGTRRYAGRPMPKHLAIPELSDAHFQRWLTLFRERRRSFAHHRSRHCSSNAPSASATTSVSASRSSAARSQWTSGRSAAELITFSSSSKHARLAQANAPTSPS